MAKRHYLPVTADVPGVSDGEKAFLRKVIREALKAEGIGFPCEVDVQLTNDAGIHKINLEMRNVDRPRRRSTGTRTGGSWPIWRYIRCCTCWGTTTWTMGR